MGNSRDRTGKGFLDMIVERLSAVERRLPPPPLSGPTDRRDLYYPIPADAPGKLALANKAPIWYNTDLGYWQGYFAPAQVGLTPRGLAGGNLAGWYPLVAIDELGPPFAP